MLKIIIRGGGDLASGIAVRLHHAGIKVVVTEVAQPLTVRRFVSFAEAVYTQNVTIEEISGRLVRNLADMDRCFTNNSIPVIVDKDLTICSQLGVQAIVDARMLKRKVIISERDIPLKIGIGPGFFPGENCHCVVETQRGPYLGRVFWKNPAEPDNGIPEKVAGYEKERVLRSPDAGIFKANVRIGDIVEKGEVIASVNGKTLQAPFRGVIRGLLHEGLEVTTSLKVGDLDPRCDPLLCSLVSDKALAVGGGVLEAILSLPENRERLSSGD